MKPVITRMYRQSHSIRPFASKCSRPFPITPEQTKSSFYIGYHGLFAASPFLEPCLHIGARHQVVQGSDDLVEDDVDDAVFLRLSLIPKRRIPPRPSPYPEALSRNRSGLSPIPLHIKPSPWDFHPTISQSKMRLLLPVVRFTLCPNATSRAPSDEIHMAPIDRKISPPREPLLP